MLNSSNLMSAQMGTILVGSLFRDDVQSLWTCEIDDVQRPGTYWSDDRCKEYIQSICSGLAPTPIVFVARDSSSPRRIIDGQHRVNAIRRFIHGEILLPKSSNERYSSVTLRPFPNWNEEAQRRFFNEKLIVSLFLPNAGTVLTDEQWWDEKTLLFKNLNSSRPVSKSDIVRLECQCEDAPFNKILEPIIYYDSSENGGYVFKPDKGARCALQALTLCAYSYILGEVNKLYPVRRQGGNNGGVARSIVEIKKSLILCPGECVLKSRIEIMHDAILSSRYTSTNVSLGKLYIQDELINAVIALAGLFAVKRVNIEEVWASILKNADRYSSCDVITNRITQAYRYYLQSLKQIYDKNKKITASDMLKAAE